jgi:hypothetical protein
MSAFQLELHLTEQFALRRLYASGVSLTGLTFLVTSRLSSSTTMRLSEGVIPPAFDERRKATRCRAISSPTRNGLSK